MANLSDYIVKFNSVDTLASVTARGSTTSSNITVGNLTSTGIDDNATSTALTVTDSGIAATLTTASQPNITSVGTLSGFSSTGIDDNATSTAITIDASENVGIGSASPTALLEVGNDGVTSYATPALSLLRNHGAQSYINRQGMQFYWNTSNGSGESEIVYGNNSTAFFRLIHNNNGTFTERMRIDSSGNVGIGTTSPLNQLVISEGTGQHGIEFAAGTTSYIQAYDRAISDYGDLKIDAQIIQFGTDNGTERMRISSGGDVQIGTAAVTGGRYFDIYNTGATATDFAITRLITQQAGSASTTSADIIKRKNGQFGFINNDTNAAAYINFKVGASERMRIDSSGKVGIGTTSPDTTLHIQSANGVKSEINLAQTAVTNYRISVPASTDALTFLYGASTERMRIDANGNVGIGLIPNTWSTGKAVELGFEGNALWGNAADEIIVSQNAYYNSGWKYATTRAASHYSQYNGAHRWFTAASGTADAALTWTQAMTLDANGNLGIGVSNPLNSLHINTGVSSRVTTTNGTQELYSGVWASQPRIQAINGTLEISSYGSYDITFATNGAERMRINSSGLVGVNTSNPR